jgi:hypothetical protein
VREADLRSHPKKPLNKFTVKLSANASKSWFFRPNFFSLLLLVSAKVHYTPSNIKPMLSSISALPNSYVMPLGTFTCCKIVFFFFLLKNYHPRYIYPDRIRSHGTCAPKRRWYH